METPPEKTREKTSNEIVQGRRLLDILQSLIHSRQVCRMEIPHTDFAWITLLLGLQNLAGSSYLLIDRVAGFEKVFSRYSRLELLLEFLEKDGVPCQFYTRVVECQPKAILAEVPASIVRMQKRRFYRIQARSGTEVIFQRKGGKGTAAKVKDYSIGGIALFVDRSLSIQVGETVAELELRIPQGDQWVCFQIPQSIVKRKGKDYLDNEFCVLEFLNLPETSRDLLVGHIFEEERAMLKKTKRA